jgi:phage/plasmid-associated DNA primase
VLDFARAGFERLVKNGFRYTVPEASKRELEEWQDETDSVKLFVQAVEAGEVKIAHEGGGDGFILGQTVYAHYAPWVGKIGMRAYSQPRFYKELVRCGVKRVTKNKRGQAFCWDALKETRCQF